MAKRTKLQPQDRGFMLFDVLYEGGSRASNHRVPMELLTSLDGDVPATDFIASQDEEIARRSGRERRVIESVERSPKRVATTLNRPFTSFGNPLGGRTGER